MGISFNQLCGYFKENSINILKDDNNLTLFNDAKLITKNQTVFLKDIIYVGLTSMLQPQFSNTEGSCFVLINDSNIELREFLKNRLNVIELAGGEDTYEIFNYVRDIFIEDNEIVRQTATLLKSAIIGKGIDHIVKVTSEILNNPVIIIDTSYKVIGHSALDDITDKLWRENIQRGYCSYDFIAEVKKMKSIQEGVRSNLPFTVTCKDSPILRIVSNIKIENKYVGNIILLSCKRHFLPRDYELLLLASQIAGEEMKKNNFYRNTNNIVYEEIIYDILDGSLTDKEVLQERIKSAHVKFSKNISVLVFDISKYRAIKRNSGYLTDAFSSFFPLKNSVFYRDDIVVIYENQRAELSIKNNIRLQEFLIENRLYLGISKEFGNVLECKKYYQQAIKAIEVGKVVNSKSVINYYSDLQFYDLLAPRLKNSKQEEYYHPALMKLRDYDRLNNGDLYNTFYVYLKNNKHVQKTSEELLIHRNTTRYRIQKIIDIIELDISDSENLFNIYMSYKILNYLKEKKNENIG